MKLSPKICTAIVFDASKQLRLVVKTAQGGAFDTNVDLTIPAGTYYIAWDNQSDDLLWQIMSLAYTGFEATSIAAYDNGTYAGKPLLGLNSDGKVTISNDGSDIKFAWTSLDGAEIGAILGFSVTAALDVTTGSATADYQSAYVWYAADQCGFQIGREDISVVAAAQSMSESGASRTTYLDERFRNQLALLGVPLARMLSGGVGYAEAPVDPYARNVPLECWWETARQGVPFRIYLDGTTDDIVSELVSYAELTGVAGAASTTTTLSDTGKSMSTEPQTHKGKLLWCGNFNGLAPARFFISSHTDTVFTIPNALFATQLDSLQYFVLAQRYRTYVVDLNQMTEFAPTEVSPVPLYDISIPLLRWVVA